LNQPFISNNFIKLFQHNYSFGFKKLKNKYDFSNLIFSIKYGAKTLKTDKMSGFGIKSAKKLTI